MDVSHIPETEKSAVEEIAELRAMLRSAMCLVHALMCPGCGQGRAMAAKCCRDVDCDAGWHGIACDEVKDFLEAADKLMPPGTLAEIENPSEPINQQDERHAAL
jgi:hypothetical protein